MINLPKTLKFKKVKSNELILEAGLVTNRHWIMNTDWLMSLEKTIPLNLKSLQNRVKKEQVEIVKERLSGKEREKSKVEEVFNSFNLLLPNYIEFPREEIKFFIGYRNNKEIEQDIAYVSLNKGKKKTYLDIEYAASLFFCLKTKIFISSKDNISPVFLKDPNDKIVLGISPLNPKFIEERNKNE